VSHPNGTMTIPNTTVPKNCIDANMTPGVPRSERVTTIRNANATLPPSAIAAGQPNTPADGRSAIRTPQKPTPTAAQRLISTCSPSKSADNAVTKIGAAR
jgi:hypothetical protein